MKAKVSKEKIEASEGVERNSIGVDLGGLVALSALVGVMVSIFFVYKYLHMMGRGDLFIDAVAGDNASLYILALGALFGSLAFLVFVLPSCLLIMADDFARGFVSSCKRSGFHKSLLVCSTIIIVFMIIAVSVIASLKLDYTVNYTFSALGVMCLFVSHVWFKRKYFRPLKLGEKPNWKNYTLPGFFFWLVIGFLIFSSSLYTYGVAMAVLTLRSWEDNMSSLFLAYALSLLNMIATLIPAMLYFVSNKNSRFKRMFAFSFGCILFVFVLIFSVPSITDVVRYNVARIIGANDKEVWVYKVSRDMGGVFSGKFWSKSYNANNNELNAKLLYGMGGVKVLCPEGTVIDVRNDNYHKEDTLKCILISSRKVVKIRQVENK